MKIFKVFSLLIALAWASVTMAQSGPKWLQQAVLYQVYPSSFMDSDGNGIGDLPGITSKMGYIESLGANVVWLSPVYVSGWKDGGYDVIDYYKIDPRFGTNTDLVELVNEAHRHGIKVLMDLVAGHSSDQCEWFLQSKEGDANQRYSDYYIWTDEIPDSEKQLIVQRHQAENPEASTIGRFVEANAPRAKYYEKNYYESQPALNYGYANPNPSRPWEQSVNAPGPRAVRQQLMDIMTFWFDKGVDGFRVDMAQSLVKGDKNYEATAALWREITAWKNQHYPECVLVAEWSNPLVSIPAGFNVDFFLPWRSKNGFVKLIQPEPWSEHATNYFHLNGKGDPTDFITYYSKCLQEIGDKGYVSVPLSDHDFARPNYGSRNTTRQLKIAMTFSLTLRSVPFIYYGDEIGMKFNTQAPAVEGSLELGDDGFRFERAGARTPMQWTNGVNAGFSTASSEKLYLPVDTDGGNLTVETQMADPNSLLNHVRALLKLRKESKAMGNTGNWEFMGDLQNPYPMIYKRSDGKEVYIVALNPSGRKVKATISAHNRKAIPVIMVGKAKYKAGKSEDVISLDGQSAVIFKMIE